MQALACPALGAGLPSAEQQKAYESPRDGRRSGDAVDPLGSLV